VNGFYSGSWRLVVIAWLLLGVGLAGGCAGISGKYSSGASSERVTVELDAGGKVRVDRGDGDGEFGLTVDLVELLKHLGGSADTEE
jgi:hypothetical protein